MSHLEPKIKESIDKLLKIIDNHARNSFFGKLTINFENGKITHLKEEKTYKL